MQVGGAKCSGRKQAVSEAANHNNEIPDPIPISQTLKQDNIPNVATQESQALERVIQKPPTLKIDFPNPKTLFQTLNPKPLNS